MTGQSPIDQNDENAVAIRDPLFPFVFLAIGTVVASMFANSSLSFFGIMIASWVVAWGVVFGYERWVA